MVTVALGQQRPVPPTFTRPAVQGRGIAQLNLDAQQQVPQPFRRVSLPLYRGRGFSLEGQEPIKPQVAQQTFQPRPVENVNVDAAAVDDAPQPTRQAPQHQFERTQQQQVDRVQHQQQHIDRIQSQPEKQFPGFRPQVYRKYKYIKRLSCRALHYIILLLLYSLVRFCCNDPVYLDRYRYLYNL